MKTRFKYCFILVFFGLLFLHNISWGQKYTIKFATLAPEGSTWMNIMREFDRELRLETNGDVGFRIYGGGVLGDESDVMRKIRIGQLHAAGFTGLGMGHILPIVHLLETPFLYRNTEEVDFIFEKFGEYYAENFSEKGYELLGWAEVGFVYVFTKEPVENLEDMRKVKMWVWEGEPVAEATFKSFGLNPIPLSVLDVMTALQTNMVNGVYTSPLAVIALQWFTKVKYMMEIPLTNGAGGVLISKRMYNKIPEEQREILNGLAKKYLAKLTQLSRADNTAAIETLKENGITVVPPLDSATLLNYYRLGASTRKDMVGRFYSQDLLDEVESALEEYRKSSRNRR